jgi:hypothetical protein
MIADIFPYVSSASDFQIIDDDRILSKLGVFRYGI